MIEFNPNKLFNVLQLFIEKWVILYLKSNTIHVCF